MEIPSRGRILSHDQAFRTACAQLTETPEFCIIRNPEIPVGEINCVVRVRLIEKSAAGLAQFATSNRLSVLVDSETQPAGLAAALEEAGFSSRGRQYLCILDPEAMVVPPGGPVEFTAVGPGEIQAFAGLAVQGSDADVEAGRLLWSFRLRNLLFSAYLAYMEGRPAGSFALFHTHGLARLECLSEKKPGAEFVLGCRMLETALQRSRAKDCHILYAFVREERLETFRSLGFTVQRTAWIEEFQSPECEG